MKEQSKIPRGWYKTMNECILSGISGEVAYAFDIHGEVNEVNADNHGREGGRARD